MKSTELTIEHLKGYLGTGLKVYIQSELYPNPEIIGIVRDVVYLNYHGAGLSMNINKIKPILYPLSEITKEIEFDGEKFVPFKKLQWEWMDGEMGNRIYCEYGESPKAVVNVLDHIDDYFKLLKWHFDIHGLIEQGLAIDKSKL